MKKVAVGARVVGACVGAVVLVPVAVARLVEIGVAGTWRWLPACLVLVAGVAGCAAAALWWPHKRLRVAAALAALAWGTVAVSSAYWPSVTTRGEVRAAFDRVHYEDSVVDPTVWELGPAWCTPADPTVMGCPSLSVGYLVREGEGDAVVAALEEADFQLLGKAERPVEDFDYPASGSTGVGSRYWLADDGMRVVVTVISDQLAARPLEGLEGPDGPDIMAYYPSSTERVEVEIRDAEDRTRLDLQDLGFWAPDASLDDLQPPAGW